MSLTHETEMNLYDFYKELAINASLESGVFEDVDYVWNQVGGWPSFIISDVKAESGSIHLIAEAIEKGNLPAFWIRPIRDDNFNTLALGSGIRLVNKWMGMEYHSSELFPMTGMNSDLKFSRVEKNEDLGKWSELANSFRMTSSSIDPEVLKCLLRDDRYKFFSLERDRELISTILLFIKDGVAGIYFVVAAERERGKGYGSEIVRLAVNYCISKGIFKFVLHSTKMGFSMYRKLGFTENIDFGIYWKMGKY